MRYAAARVPVAIVSGAFRAEIEPVVAAAGIAGEVTAIVAADDVEHGKPHPEAYLTRARAARRRRLTRRSPSRTPRRAIASAKAAGLRCLAVRGTLPDERLAAADELVDGIDTDLVRRLIG